MPIDIRVARLLDADKIKNYMKPYWDDVTDDGCAPMEQYVVDAKNPNKYFLEITEDNKFVGLVALYKLNCALCEIHVLIDKEFRKRDLNPHFNVVKEFIRKFTTLKSAITFHPIKNKHVTAFSLRHGWVKKCEIKKAILKNGVLEDCILLELEL